MNIFDEICKALREDGYATIATVIQTSGSTPIPAQARMLLRTKHSVQAFGSIGGGCLDGAVYDFAMRSTAPNSERITFDLNDELQDTGLSCGGSIEVLFERIDQSQLVVYESIVAELSLHSSALIVTSLSDDNSCTKSVLNSSLQVLAGTEITPEIRSIFSSHSVESKTESGLARFATQNGEIFVDRVTSSPGVIIFGCGHVGAATARIAMIAGFDVTVVDDRALFADARHFPGARVILAEFEDAIRQINFEPNHFIVIATRGHRHDADILERVIALPSRYIGMIGSRRKVALTCKELIAKGISEDRLNQIHAPIGLDIGAVTAEEIGVSIVAELIANLRSTQSNRTHASLSNIHTKRI